MVKAKFVKGMLIGAVAGGMVGAAVEECCCNSAGKKCLKWMRKCASKLGMW